jgi:hypothetical protein
MAENITEFGQQAEVLKAGRDKTAVEQAYKTDPAFREKTLKIMSDFGNKQNKLKMDMWRIKGTAARLNMPAPSPSGQPTSKP